MERSFIKQKNDLFLLINKVSKHHGGDDEKFITDYSADIVFKFRHDLGVPLATFQELASHCFTVIKRSSTVVNGN